MRNAASATTHSSCSPWADAGHRRRHDVAGADAGRGDEQPGADQPDDAGRGRCGVLCLNRPPPGVRYIYALMTSTAAATARVLADAGIERVFGLPGGEVLVLMDELRRAGVDFVLMRHEANAGLAAAVYGKLRRQPGVVLTTLGPGAANLMLPLSNAYLDLEPLLAISAQIPDDFPPSHTHQLLPLHDAYRPIARYVEKITGENVLDVVPQALATLHGASVRRVVSDAVRPRGARGRLPGGTARAVGAETDARTAEHARPGGRAGQGAWKRACVRWS